MVIATRMPMPTVMGMPMAMCTGTSTIGKHAPGITMVIRMIMPTKITMLKLQSKG